jgi:hypothetical protein
VHDGRLVMIDLLVHGARPGGVRPEPADLPELLRREAMLDP